VTPPTGYLHIPPAKLDGPPVYRGRLAPSPTGLLHLGHARTFQTAHQRARERNGTLVMRIEDLDRSRCRPEFTQALLEDLHWIGLEWQEGGTHGGPYGPYSQSERLPLYRDAFEQLRRSGHLFACTCSRREIQQSALAPHPGDDEPIYPGTCRLQPTIPGETPRSDRTEPSANWRFRVPQGTTIEFIDGMCGPQRFVAGVDFGDFVVWRNDDTPSYQLAVTVDDAAMHITEVVRGEDLLRSTARQLLLYHALGFQPPAFAHCPLVTDASGIRLAKRHQSLSLRALRESGKTPQDLLG
jgi:glutamyl/glutaminyl-tRNA synthetase